MARVGSRCGTVATIQRTILLPHQRGWFHHEDSRERSVEKIRAQTNIMGQVVRRGEIAKGKGKISETPMARPGLNGNESYAEMTRQVRLRYHQMQGNGGKRSKKGEEKIRRELAEEFQVPASAIDECLSHSEFLNDKTLNSLAQSREGPGFFDDAQKVKRILIKNYKSNNLTDSELTNRISKSFLEMFKEFQKERKIDRDHWISDGDPAKGKGNGSKKKNGGSGIERKFKYWSGNKNSGQIRPFSLAEIDHELREASESIRNVACSKSKGEQRSKKLKQEILRLSEILEGIKNLIQPNSPAKKKTSYGKAR